MSRIFLFFLVIPSGLFGEPFSLSTTATWHNFGEYKHQDTVKKTTLTELLTFRSKEPLKLNLFKLRWMGKPLNSPAISLYKQIRKNDLLAPIEQNVVSDGIWQPKKQEVSFKLNEKLIAINKYYLVVSYLPSLESNLKSGRFVLAKKSPFKIKPLR